MLAEIAREDVAGGVEIRAAMMGHDALGIARGAGRVTERDGVPFVLGMLPGERRIARFDRRLVFQFADPPAAAERRVVHIDHQRFRAAHQLECVGDHAGEFRIDQNDLRAAMVELECDRGCVQPDVERVQNRARHGHGKMQFIHRRNVRQHGGDRIAATDAAPGQKRCEASAALVSLRPGEAAAFVDGAGQVRIDGRAARQEAQRCQRDIVGRGLVQTDAVVTLMAHDRLPESCRALTPEASCGCFIGSTLMGLAVNQRRCAARFRMRVG